MNIRLTIRHMLAASPLLLAYTGGIHAAECGDPCTVTDAVTPEIQLLDSSANATHWEIEATSDGSTFQIGTTAAVEPFKIEDGAASNTLVIDEFERIGVNTAAPAEDLQINSAQPAIRLDDTTVDQGQADLMMTGSTFIIEGDTGLDLLTLRTDGPAAGIHVDEEGNVGLGTIFSDWNLALSGDGSIFMENGNDDWLVTNGTTGLWFGNGVGPAANNGKVKFNNQAPDNSLVVEGFGSGDIGMGTAAPTASLEVTRTDGTAQILVDENNGTEGLRQLFRLENNGDPSFVFQDTSTGADTEFRLFGSSDSFAINHITGGVNGAEFRLDRAGNLFITGTLTQSGALTQVSDIAAKTAIVAVMPEDILDRIQALPISSWQYKADAPEVRHVGPMAQDFHATFGLGANDTTIAPADMASVALAGIQAQQQELEKKDEQIAALQARLSAIEASLTK